MPSHPWRGCRSGPRTATSSPTPARSPTRVRPPTASGYITGPSIRRRRRSSAASSSPTSTRASGFTPSPRASPVTAPPLPAATIGSATATGLEAEGPGPSAGSQARRHTLSGLVSCGLCGRRMQRQPKPYSHYYRCRFPSESQPPPRSAIPRRSTSKRGRSSPRWTPGSPGSSTPSTSTRRAASSPAPASPTRPPSPSSTPPAASLPIATPPSPSTGPHSKRSADPARRGDLDQGGRSPAAHRRVHDRRLHQPNHGHAPPDQGPRRHSEADDPQAAPLATPTSKPSCTGPSASGRPTCPTPMKWNSSRVRQSVSEGRVDLPATHPAQAQTLRDGLRAPGYVWAQIRGADGATVQAGP